MDALEYKLQQANLRFIDIDFPPLEKSVYDSPSMDSPFDTLIHWRRPEEFMRIDPGQGLLETNVFYESIEPNDIR